ncbi:MAG: His/Gly/Thr/Pro-type tRNA ligase C-terminal domain-containing protein, partial [Paracoccaceae bacterium]|nr:His/Gly/Thr/Pro-type tRNA ligase C-terminal domain-containing protein [Paracoccaceae bacterium]
SRLVGAIIEAFHDDKGIKWPISVAPFKVGIVNTVMGDRESCEISEKIYSELSNANLDPLYDDRDERVGSKFTTMELIGIPWRITVGPRGLKKGIVELTDRHTGESREIPTDKIVSQIIGKIKPTPNIQIYSYGIIPKLKFAKLLDASFDDAKPEKTYWNGIVKLALTKVMESCNNVVKLKKISGAKVIDGNKVDSKFKFIPSHNFSYHVDSSIDAAKIVQKCANYLGCDAYFEFEWKYKEGAFKPGERALLYILESKRQ